MTRTVLLPRWLDPPALPGLEYRFRDSGDPVPDPADLERITFYVPPYMCPIDDVALGAQMPQLAVVQALMAGVDGWDEVLPPRVRLIRAAGVHDDSTAELAVGLIIAAQRGIDVAARDMVRGRWRHVRRRSLDDARVGILGWGGVGRAVARRLAAFECEVVAFTRTAGDGTLPLSSLDRRLPSLDIVVLALPLTDQTRHIVDERLLARMTPGALLVNVGRGALVDTDALVAAVAAGRVRAALDVTDPEPPPPDHPLWRTPGVLITPHLGGDSAAFVPRAKRMVAEQLRRFAAGEPLAR